MPRNGGRYRKPPGRSAQHRRIADIGTDGGLAALARELFREYQRELGVDLCFQGFDAELGVAAGPLLGSGRLPADGRTADEVVGCVGLRPLDRRVAELKRLYVRPAARGRGSRAG